MNGIEEIEDTWNIQYISIHKSKFEKKECDISTAVLCIIPKTNEILMLRIFDEIIS